MISVAGYAIAGHLPERSWHYGDISADFIRVTNGGCPTVSETTAILWLIDEAPLISILLAFINYL